MPDVRMPDGTIIRNVPEGTTQRALMERLRRAQQPGETPPTAQPPTAQPPAAPAPATPSPAAPEAPAAQPAGRDASSTIAFTESALRRFANNVLGLPQGMLNLSAAAARGVGLPAGPTVDLGLPDLDDLAAVGQGLERATGAFMEGQSFNLPELIREERETLAQRVQEQQEAAPVATTLGQTAGDIATIATGRGGVRMATGGRNLAELAPKINTTAQTVLGRALQGFGRSAVQTGARAAETAVEGAFLASLRDSDPAEVAAMAAGSQVFGDVALSTFKRLARGNNLLKAIAYGTIASLGIQQLTPGGLDRILPTLEGRNKEAIITMILGGAAGSAIGGRVPKGFAGPAFAELVDVTRRGALLSLLTSLARDPVRTTPVVQKFTEDPEYFGDRAKRLLTRAMNSEEIDIRSTVDTLMKDRAFRRKFEALER